MKKAIDTHAYWIRIYDSPPSLTSLTKERGSNINEDASWGELSREELGFLLPHFVGLPVIFNHLSNDQTDQYCIPGYEKGQRAMTMGLVVRSVQHPVCGSVDLLIRPYNATHGQILVNMIEGKICLGWSLQHQRTADKVLMHEVSICKQGKRPNTWLRGIIELPEASPLASSSVPFTLGRFTAAVSEPARASREWICWPLHLKYNSSQNVKKIEHKVVASNMYTLLNQQPSTMTQPVTDSPPTNKEAEPHGVVSHSPQADAGSSSSSTTQAPVSTTNQTVTNESDVVVVEHASVSTDKPKLQPLFDVSDPKCAAEYFNTLCSGTQKLMTTLASEETKADDVVPKLIDFVFKFAQGAQCVLQENTLNYDTIASLRQQLQSVYKTEAASVHKNLMDTLMSAASAPDPKLFSLASYIQKHPEICAHLTNENVYTTSELSGTSNAAGTVSNEEYSQKASVPMTTKRAAASQLERQPGTAKKYKPLADMFNQFCDQQKQVNREFNASGLVRPTVPVGHLNQVSSRASMNDNHTAPATAYPSLSDMFNNLDNQTASEPCFPASNLARRTSVYSSMV
jgi:hypothetical protein